MTEQLHFHFFTFHLHALEKEMATHFSILAWRIPGTEEPVGLPSMGSHRVGHGWRDLAAAAAADKKSCFGLQIGHNKEHKSVMYGLWGKSISWPLIVNNVILKHIHTHSVTHHPRPLLSSKDKQLWQNIWPGKPKIFTK